MPLAAIHAAFNKWLSLPSNDLLDVVAATVIANRLPGEPLWLAIVAPPSSGKSEVLRTLSGLERVLAFDLLSPAALVSGYRADKKSRRNHSLLARLDGGAPWLLVMEDFTVLLSQPWDKRDAVLGQLRTLYDGHFQTRWGNDQSLDWHGKLGMIVASTPAYDRKVRQSQLFGDRFLVFRPTVGDPFSVAERAGRLAQKSEQMRAELAAAMRGLDSVRLPKGDVPVPLALRKQLADLAVFVARVKAAIPRDLVRQEIEGLPEQEGAARLSRQLHQLTRGFAALSGRPPGDAELALAERVAYSTIPSLRVDVLRAMPLKGDIDRPKLESSLARFPRTVLHRTLEELRLLGLIEHLPLTGQKGVWRLAAGVAPFAYRMRERLQSP